MHCCRFLAFAAMVLALQPAAASDRPRARDLGRLAARAVYAMARTGSTYSNGSGDYAIAFSTHPALRAGSGVQPVSRVVLPADALSPLFEAVMDATEEAIYDSLLQATDMTGNGHAVRALPVGPLLPLLTTRR